MEIVKDKQSEPVAFKNVPIGDVCTSEHSGALYLKLASDEGDNAFHIESKVRTHVAPHIPVIHHKKAQLIINP